MQEERAMLLFARLAAVSESRRQFPGRDRFLILAGAAATRAGCPEVAERCRRAVSARSTRHLLGRYASFADALRDEEFRPFLRQTEKFCSVERAEHLLNELDLLKETETYGDSASASALAILAGVTDADGD